MTVVRMLFRVIRLKVVTMEMLFKIYILINLLKN